MPNYTFTDVEGATLVFDPATDRLLFAQEYEAASLRIVQTGADVRVLHSGALVRLAGLSTAQFDGSQFLFASGAVARFGSTGPDAFTGSAGDDAFYLEQGGRDSVFAGGGKDRIDLGAALDANDAIDGGAGANDTLVLTGNHLATVVFGASTVTGVESFELLDSATSGAVRLELHAATLSTASAAVAILASALTDPLFLDGRAGRIGFSVRSGAGNDTLIGGAGADTLAPGAGADLLTGGAGDDRFVFALEGRDERDDEDDRGDSSPDARDTISDFATGDHLEFVQDFFGRHLVFNAQPLAFDADASAVQASLHADDGLADIYWHWGKAAQRVQVWIDEDDDGRVGEGDFLLNLATASSGKTSLEAADIATALARRGTTAADELAGDAGDNVLAGDAGDDTVAGGDGVDVLFGNAGNDSLVGGGGDDRLSGGAGKDTLDGGTGSNRLDGGAGNDTYRVRSVDDAIVEDAWSDGGSDTVLSYLTDHELDATVEHGSVRRADGARLEGNHFDNRLKGAAGDDTLVGARGNDTLDGGAGANALTGGEEGDTYVVRSASDRVHEQDDDSDSSYLRDLVQSHGADITLAANVEDGAIMLAAGARLTGNKEHNALRGNVGQDTLRGSSGDDTLDGGAGGDHLEGGKGDDTYRVDASSDTIVELAGAGTDSVIATASFTLEADLEQLSLAGSTAIDGAGNALANELLGNSAANVLDGRAGADDMDGGKGDDTYLVDNAKDQVNEERGGGIDTVIASVSRTLGLFQEHLTLAAGGLSGTGNSLANQLRGSAHDDVLDGAAGKDTLAGGLGNDTYRVDGNDDLLQESANAGVDTVISSGSITLGLNLENLTLTGAARTGVGNGAANLLRGTIQDNVLDGAAGADTLRGGQGDDVYKVDHSGDVVVESARRGTDTVISVVGHRLADHVENLRLGGTAAIAATGNALANELRGNAAANRLDGGAGADTMEGGLGNDTYLVDHAGDEVSESRTGGVDTVISTASRATLDRYVENLTLEGSARAGEGNDLANMLRGNDAANDLDGAKGADTLVGGLGNDTYHVDNLGDVLREAKDGGVDTVVSQLKSYVLGEHLENLSLDGFARNAQGNALANVIRGSGGRNVLDGGGGKDTLVGGEGADTYLADADDVILEEDDDADDGSDTVIVDVSWTLAKGLENLRLTGSAALSGTGNSGENHILGNDGANVLDGGRHEDALEGGKGNDTYHADSWFDTVIERAGGGVDQVIATASFTLADHVENLVLRAVDKLVTSGVGNDSANLLDSDGGRQSLRGHGGNDTLSAGEGADTLDGGDGADRLAGGKGDDIFFYVTMSESLRGQHDVITDFQRGSDQIVFPSWGWPEDREFIGTERFGDDATGQLRYAWDAATRSVMLYGSSDADARAEFVVQLLGISSLAAGDVVV